jgi:hypothetical protein
MWDNEIGGKIARILQLLVDLPNLRREGSTQLFDGGRLIEDTGITVLELADGTEIFHGSGEDLHLTIKFPEGGKAEISVHKAG